MENVVLSLEWNRDGVMHSPVKVVVMMMMNYQNW